MSAVHDLAGPAPKSAVPQVVPQLPPQYRPCGAEFGYGAADGVRVTHAWQRPSRIWNGSRRPVIGQLNRGEGRHNLCREVFHGRQSEMRQPYREGMEEQVAALGLVANYIIPYNTLYTQRIVEELRAHGHKITDEDLRRLSPLLVEHINLVGRYHIALAEAIMRGRYRPLKRPALTDVARA